MGAEESCPRVAGRKWGDVGEIAPSPMRNSYEERRIDQKLGSSVKRHDTKGMGRAFEFM